MNRAASSQSRLCTVSQGQVVRSRLRERRRLTQKRSIPLPPLRLHQERRTEEVGEYLLPEWQSRGPIPALITLSSSTNLQGFLQSFNREFAKTTALMMKNKQWHMFSHVHLNELNNNNFYCDLISCYCASSEEYIIVYLLYNRKSFNVFLSSSLLNEEYIRIYFHRNSISKICVVCKHRRKHRIIENNHFAAVCARERKHK